MVAVHTPMRKYSVCLSLSVAVCSTQLQAVEAERGGSRSLGQEMGLAAGRRAKLEATEVT